MIRHSSPISGVDCSEGFVATAGYDNRLILWRFDAYGSPRGVSIGMHDHLVNHCQFSHDGGFIVSASSDYSARVWSCNETGLQLQAVLSGHEDDVEMACFSSTDQLIATASRDHTIRIFDRGGACLRTMRGHRKDVLSVHWSAADKFLVSSSDDGCVITWDCSTGEPVRFLDLGDTEADTIAIGPDDIVFTGDDRGQITAISANGNTHYQAHRSGIKRLVINRSRTLLLSASYDRRLCLWKLESGGIILIREVSIPVDAWPRCLCIGQDARQIHMGSFGAAFRTYDIAKDEWISLGENKTHGLNSLAFYHDKLWSVGDAGMLRSDQGDIIDLGSLCNTLLGSSLGLFAAGQQGVVFLVRSREAGGYQSFVLYQHNCPINCSLLSADTDGRPVALFGTYNGELLRLPLDSSSASSFHADVLSVMPNAVKGLAAFEPGCLFGVCANGDAVWFSERGVIQHRMPAAHHKIANACVRIDSDLIASVSRDLCLYLWSRDGLVKRIITPHRHSIKCLAYHAPWIITASYDGCLYYYDLNSECWSRHHDRPTCAGISSLLIAHSSSVDGACILASSYDGTIYTTPIPQG